MEVTNKMKIFISIFFIIFLFQGCDLNFKTVARKTTIFIGIDVSGSFTKTKAFKDSLKFRL